MTNYIIDPSVFYWMNVLGILQTVFGILGAVTLTGFVVVFGSYLFDLFNLEEPNKPAEDEDRDYMLQRYREKMDDYLEEKRKLTKQWKMSLTILIVGAVFVLLSVFIPGKTTSVEMLVARTATFENVDWTVSQVKEIVDYIVSAISAAV